MRDRLLATVLLVAAAAIAVFVPSDAPVEGCGGTMSPMQMVDTWPRDEYLLVLLGGSDRSAFDVTRDAVKELGRKVNIRTVDAAPEKPGVKAPSAAVLLSPRGRILARFESPPGLKELARHYRSPKRDEIVKALAKHDAVVLLYAGPKAAHAAENAKLAAAELKLARDLYDPTAVILTLDPTDAAERTLVRNLGIEPKPASEGFVIILAKGRCLPPVPGKTASDAVLDRLNYLFSLSNSCYPHQLDEDLLLDLR